MISQTRFKKIIYEYYKKYHRDLPWRNTKNPYYILVSEIMLQQTQAGRVIEKYTDFISTFPTINILAQASLRSVFKKWSGLGYNRRGLYLHNTAKVIVEQYKGIVPKDTHVLKTFPGIGPYTAQAIITFAYNQPGICIETNIRSVYLHFFFTDCNKKVHDNEILPLIEHTLDMEHPRDWYYALMDYGTMLKTTQQKNPSQKSIHYTKQAPFKNSDREVRGAIIRTLTQSKYSKYKLIHLLNFDKVRIEKNLTVLINEGLVIKNRNVYSIA